MRLPAFLQFTPEERRAVLALLLFTGGGGLLLELAEHFPRLFADGLRHAAPVEPPAGVDSLAPVGTDRLVASHAGVVAARPPGPVDSAQAGLSEAPARVDVNTAGEGVLTTLPGIGPRLAERIVADRGRNGPFGSVADLTRVRGIGLATVARIGSLAVAESH